MKLDTKKVLNKQIPSEILAKIAYIIISILFAIPSIIYLIQNKSVSKFIYMFSMFFTREYTIIENYINVVIYITLFSLLFFLYFYILKNINKVFKTNKSLFIFISIVRNIVYDYYTNNKSRCIFIYWKWMDRF